MKRGIVWGLLLALTLAACGDSFDEAALLAEGKRQLARGEGEAARRTFQEIETRNPASEAAAYGLVLAGVLELQRSLRSFAHLSALPAPAEPLPQETVAGLLSAIDRLDLTELASGALDALFQQPLARIVTDVGKLSPQAEFSLAHFPLLVFDAGVRSQGALSGAFDHSDALLIRGFAQSLRGGLHLVTSFDLDLDLAPLAGLDLTGATSRDLAEALIAAFDTVILPANPTFLTLKGEGLSARARAEGEIRSGLSDLLAGIGGVRGERDDQRDDIVTCIDEGGDGLCTSADPFRIGSSPPIPVGGIEVLALALLANLDDPARSPLDLSAFSRLVNDFVPLPFRLSFAPGCVTFDVTGFFRSPDPAGLHPEIVAFFEVLDALLVTSPALPLPEDFPLPPGGEALDPEVILQVAAQSVALHNALSLASAGAAALAQTVADESPESVLAVLEGAESLLRFLAANPETLGIFLEATLPAAQEAAAEGSYPAEVAAYLLQEFADRLQAPETEAIIIGTISAFADIVAALDRYWTNAPEEIPPFFLALSALLDFSWETITRLAFPPPLATKEDVVAYVEHLLRPLQAIGARYALTLLHLVQNLWPGIEDILTLHLDDPAWLPPLSCLIEHSVFSPLPEAG